MAIVNKYGAELLIAWSALLWIGLATAHCIDNPIEPNRVLALIRNAEHAELTRLLDGGLDANMRVPLPNGPESLLIAACIFSDDTTVRILLAHGARADPPILTGSGTMGDSSVAIAMNRWKPELMELLIQNGADPLGFTPLMIALMRGDIIAAEAEMRRGGDIDAVNKFGRSAFDLSHPIGECIGFLLKHHAKHSYTSTEIAVMLGDHEAVRRELENRDAQRNWQSEVWWSVFYDRPAILDLIVSAVPSAASEEFRFRTPAGLAAEKGRLECLRVLVRNHADLSRLSEGLFSPAALARRSDSNACLRFLEAVQAMSPAESKEGSNAPTGASPKK